MSNSNAEPIVLLAEMHEKFQLFAEIAEQLKQQSSIQYEQIRLLHQEIAKSKEVNERRFEMLHRAIIGGNSSAFASNYEIRCIWVSSFLSQILR